MEDKKLTTGDFNDIDTHLRFVEDVRGTLHVICPMTQMQQPNNTTIVIQNNEMLDNENKRLKRILEKLRTENNFLWKTIYTAIRKKKTPQKALDELERTIKEFTS